MATDEIKWATGVQRAEPIDTKPAGSPLLSGYVRPLRMWHGGPTEWDETPMNYAVYCRLCLDLYVSPSMSHHRCNRESCQGVLVPMPEKIGDIVLAAYKLGGWEAVRNLELGCITRKGDRGAMKFLVNLYAGG